MPPDARLVANANWIEKVQAKLDRVDAAQSGLGLEHLPAKLEVERHVNVVGDETVTLLSGQPIAQSRKIEFELRGRGIVEDQRYELGIKRPGALWLRRGVGIVRLDDAYERSWFLTSSTNPAIR